MKRKQKSPNLRAGGGHILKGFLSCITFARGTCIRGLLLFLYKLRTFC